MVVMPVDMSRERFEELVGEALDEVPVELLNVMNNVVILVEDEPPDGGDELLGLYEGHALTERGWDYAGVLPDRITIYRAHAEGMRVGDRRDRRGSDYGGARDRPPLRDRRSAVARTRVGLIGQVTP
jgi:hypothetical protein